MDDLELLKRYAEQESQEAFAELVRRHVNLVYSAALRQMRDRHAAEDVTQTVFLILTQKAAKLRQRGVVLSAWLLLATRYAAQEARRGSSRRQVRERKAAEMNQGDPRADDPARTGDTDWEKLSPLLDDAIARLADTLRGPLVLRFFENKSFKEVASRWGITEANARQRVTRGVDQLRALLAERGAAVGALSLEMLLLSHAVSDAPQGLAGGLSAIATKTAAASARKAAMAKGAAIGAIPLGSKAAMIVIIIGVAALATAAVYKMTRPAGQLLTISAGTAQSTGKLKTAARPARIRAIVKAPDGTIVPGAEVALARASAAATAYGRQPGGVLTIKSGSDGSFDFPDFDDAAAVVARADEGFAQLVVDDVTARGVIDLQPWASVEGTVRAEGKPLANQTVSLSRTGGSVELWNRWHIMHEARTKTDERGHFAFPKVAAGGIQISIADPNGQPGRSVQLTIKPGERITLPIGGSGRTIVGHISGAENFPVFLGNLQALPPTTRPTTAPAGTRLAGTMPPLQINFQANSDGSFRVPEVPPGEYVLYLYSLDGAGTNFRETLAMTQTQFAIADQAAATSDPPIDLGTLTLQVNPTLRVGQIAPNFAAHRPADPPQKFVRLSDYVGKSLFVHFVRPGEQMPWNNPAALKAIYDRYCDDSRVAMLTVMLDNSADTAQRYRAANGIEWEVAAGMLLPGVLEQFSAASTQPTSTQPAAEIVGVPSIYLHTPTHLFLIGPDGRLLAKNLTARTALDAMVLAPRDSSPSIRVEHHAPGKTSPDFKLTTTPAPQNSDDLSRGATFSLVDGQLAESSGGLRVLNDGRLPSGADSPGDSVHFSFGSLEGRFKMDLSRVASIGQINTYSWHKSDRGPQVYKVYGSDGTAPGFNANPRIGVNPATCGWTLIASVDARPTAGPAGGQYAVSIGDGAASLGSYRYLLFNTFVTETRDDWGHTFFNEIAVSSAK